MSKIIVTGAAGFIGTHLTKYLLEKGHEVVTIDNAIDFIPDIGVPVKAYRHDVSKDPNMLWAIFNVHKPDFCYCLSSYASEGRSNHIRSFIHQNNTVGTANVINACINHKCKLIFTSSVAVYSGIPPFSEDTIPNPIDEYALSKWTSEKSIQIAGDTQGLDWCIIRPRNVYGKFQNIFDPSRNLFGIFCYNALNNLPLTVFGDGSNQRSFTYIDDLIPALYNAAFVSNEIINVGSENVYSIRDAARIFASVSGYDNIIYTEPRHEVGRAYCTTEKSIRLLGFKDTVTLEKGLRKMWEWAQTVKMRALDIPPPLEVKVNTHSSLNS